MHEGTTETLSPLQTWIPGNVNAAAHRPTLVSYPFYFLTRGLSVFRLPDKTKCISFVYTPNEADFLRGDGIYEIKKEEIRSLKIVLGRGINQQPLSVVV